MHEIRYAYSNMQQNEVILRLNESKSDDMHIEIEQTKAIQKINTTTALKLQ